MHGGDGRARVGTLQTVGANTVTQQGRCPLGPTGVSRGLDSPGWRVMELGEGHWGA